MPTPTNSAPTWEETSEAPTWETTATPLEPEQMDRMSTALAADEAQRRAIATGMENGTEFLSTVANDPTGFAAAVPQIALGTLTAPGKLAYHAAADVVSRVAGQPEYGGNLRADQTGATPPVDQFLAAVSQTAPKSAVAGKVGKSLAEMSGLGAVGLLPSGLAKLAAAGFTVDMVAHAPQQFRDYAEEIAKPAAEQNPDKITSLQSDIIQTFTFAPLAGAHAARPIEGVRVGPPSLNAVGKVLPDAAVRPVGQVVADLFSKLRPEITAKSAARYERKFNPEVQQEKQQASDARDKETNRRTPIRELLPAPVLLPQQYIGPGVPPAGQYRVTDEMTRPEIEQAQAVAQAEIQAAWPEMQPEEQMAALRGRGLPERFSKRPAPVPTWDATEAISRQPGDSSPDLKAVSRELTATEEVKPNEAIVQPEPEPQAQGQERLLSAPPESPASAVPEAATAAGNTENVPAVTQDATPPTEANLSPPEQSFGPMAGAADRVAWLRDIKPVGPGTDSTRWTAIENTYKTAKAAQDALPNVPLDQIMVLRVFRKEGRKSPSQSEVVDSFFVKRGELDKLTDQLREVYPASTFGNTIDPSVKPYGPRKGEPSFKEWLAGKRPAAAPEPAPKFEDTTPAEQKSERAKVEAQVKGKILTSSPDGSPKPAPAEPALPKSQGHVAFVQHDQFTGMPVAPVEFYIKGRTLYRADTAQPIRAGVRKSGYSVELKNGKIKETGQTVAEYIKTWTDYMNRSAAQSREQMTGFAKAAEARAAEARKPAAQPARPGDASEATRAEQPAPGPSSRVLDMLNVPVPDVEAARQRLRNIEELRQPYQTEYDALKKEWENVGRVVLRSTGAKWERGKVKASAKKSDVARWRELGNKMAENQRLAQALVDSGRKDKQLVDSAVDAGVVSDPAQPLIRRLDRRVRMFQDAGQEAPKELVAALRAESAREILTRYPDATKAEIEKLWPVVEREAYFGGKQFENAWKLNPELDLFARRKAEIQSALNRDNLPDHVFSDELKQRIATKQPSASDVRDIVRAAQEETDQFRKRQAEEQARARAEAEAELAKEEQMMAEAQQIADSAKAKGEFNGRSAREVKVDLIARVQKAIDEMIAEDDIKLELRDDGTYAAASTKHSGFSFGQIEPNGDKFRVTTWRPVGDKTKISATVASLEAAQGVIKAMAAEGKGKAIIGVPGDGVFRLVRNGPALLRVWSEARKLDTSSGGGVNYSTSGGVEKPPATIRTAEQWNAAREYHGLTDGDKIATWSPALRAFAEKIEQADPAMDAESMTAAEVDAWVKKKASKPSSSGSVASPPALGGGDLGKEPSRGGPAPAVADDPRHSVFDAMPMEMPEAVRMVKALTGLYPQIRRRLGQAAGRFTFTQGENASGRVSLLASIFDLLDANDKARLKQEARNYAQAQGGSESQQARVARERYAFLLEQAYAQAKLENPKQALKVMWHEIGHVVDWLPNHLLVGRGNFFGRIASLKGYLKHVLPLDPNRIGPFQEKPTPAELSQIRKAAFDAVQAEIGPMREIVETILVEEPIYREAGITPEMVKQLFGMDARETMPELYRWFAEQPADVKKDIVRAAMKGLVDERLTKANLSGREQIGTRKIEREVRRREGRPPTPEEVEARFKQLFRAELERRNLALLEQVKAELEPTIAWWRGTAKMESYFRTSEEMYAEAFSVFANNPAALESRAPTYAKLIWNYLDRKPEVKALYDQIQAEIKSGVVMPGRVKALWDMWDTQDRHSLEVARDAAKLRGRDVLDNVQYHLDRRFGPIYRAAKGTPAQGRIADAVGNFLYRMSEHERFLAALNLEVGQRLVAHNLDWSHDLGEFLFHNRIIHERFNLANPLGWTSKNSTERLREMEATLGPERWAALRAAGEAYRAQYEKFVVAELNAARMFAPELQDALNANAHYATFAAIKGVKDNGIEQMLASRYGSGLTPHIYRQLGNLGEIRNPATATVLKGLSLISAAYRNSMKREVVQMLRRHHPEDITPASTRWNGKAREPVLVENHPSVGTILYLHEGKPYAWNVRRVVADAVNGGSGSENLAFSLLLNATGWQKGLFTQLNYGFWPFNFARDTLGWWMQMPGALAPVGWARHLPRALLAARQSVTHSQPNPWADAALRRKMLISKGDPRGTWAAADNEFEVKLASFGMDPAQWSGQADAVHRVVKAWDFYKNLGQTVERVNKIAGMLYLDEKFPSLPEWKKREIVRERAGSPNFLERGASNPAVDLLFLFYNPWKESVRSVAKSAREHPWSFSAKATTLIALPTVLQAAAVNGWLGKDRQEQYNSVPDFDLTNYLVVPLGWVNREQRRVAYLRLPLWETARIAHGLAFQAMTSRGTGMTAHAGGQLPGLNPMWKIGLAWAEYLQGKNPVDVTRAVNVMPDKTFAAGGPAVLAEMAKYTWNELGGSILYRFQNLNLESSPESEGEKLLAAPGINNALGRWIKVSDRGLADQQRQVANETKQARAEVQLGVDEILRRLTGPGSWENLMTGLQQNDPAAVQRAMAAAALSPAERMLLREPYALEYFTRKFPELVASKANINARMWFNSQSNDERAKLIQRGIIQPTVPAP